MPNPFLLLLFNLGSRIMKKRFRNDGWDGNGFPRFNLSSSPHISPPDDITDKKVMEWMRRRGRSVSQKDSKQMELFPLKDITRTSPKENNEKE